LQLGYLSLARKTSYVARSDFESALTHFPDHPSAIVGLSNILLDIYSEELLPPPVIPAPSLSASMTDLAIKTDKLKSKKTSQDMKVLPTAPLGLEPGDFTPVGKPAREPLRSPVPPLPLPKHEEDLTPPYKTKSIPIVDRLAARDRAYGLLSGLTKLGTGWNYSEAWFALARAHEESEQPEKAKEALWWCVELEEGQGVREWRSLSSGGYVV
jgi:cargo-transport protein YPP1